jgi:hypothetical protein
MAQAQWTENDVHSMLMDPRYTGLDPFPRVVSDDQWIAANAKLIGEMGAVPYFTALLKVLAGPPGPAMQAFIDRNA